LYDKIIKIKHIHLYTHYSRGVCYVIWSRNWWYCVYINPERCRYLDVLAYVMRLALSWNASFY